MKEISGYLIRILIVFGIIILLIFAFNFIRNLFDREEDNRQAPRSFDLKKAVEDGETLRYTTHGAIVGREEHRKIRITVTPDRRVVEVIQGYQGDILKSQQFANTREAYEAFAEALIGAGFTRVVNGTVALEEEKTCPLGRKYNYEVAPGSNDSFYSWANSCRGAQGTFRGEDGTIRILFQEQIPDYRRYVSDVRLG